MERETNLLTDSKVAKENLENEISLLKTDNDAEIKTLHDTQLPSLALEMTHQAY